MSDPKNIYQMNLWGIHELQQDGFSRSMAYQLLNREDLPTVQIGNRRFIHRELFQEWLRDQAIKKAVSQ